MIGTFQDETDEKVVYGLTHPVNTWNPIWIQVKKRIKNQTSILYYNL
jgi:hypothetical protein